MKFNILTYFLGLISFIVQLSAQSSSGTKAIQLSLKESVLAKQKVLKIENLVYYNLVNGDLITLGTKPIEMYTRTNTKGEMKVYDPIKNIVALSQSPGQTSANSIFNIFFSNLKADMNLKALGFQLEKTEIDKDKNIISTWKNLDPKKKIKKAKLVHENFLPIFLGFYDEKSEAITKIYYSDFVKIDNFHLPLKITEISILIPKKDSVIDRKIYSDLKINQAIDSKLVNFQIPSDAKVQQLKN